MASLGLSQISMETKQWQDLKEITYMINAIRLFFYNPLKWDLNMF